MNRYDRIGYYGRPITDLTKDELCKVCAELIAALDEERPNRQRHKDRRALSRTVRDDIGGSLAAIKMLMETRLSRCDRPPLECIMTVGEIVDRLGDIIRQCRSVSRKLHPETPDQLGK